MCIYVLVAIDHSLYTLLQILSVILFEITPILHVVSQSPPDEVAPNPSNPLILFNNRWDSSETG